MFVHILNMTLNRPHRQTGNFGKEKNLLLLHGIRFYLKISELMNHLELDNWLNQKKHIYLTSCVTWKSTYCVPTNIFITSLFHEDATQQKYFIRPHVSSSKLLNEFNLRARCVWLPSLNATRNWRLLIIAFFIWRNSPQWARASSFTGFLDHT